MEHLEIVNINKEFPGVKALENITFSIKRGTIHGLVGKNGAGKTTLVKIISGLYKPTSGKVMINGQDITDFNIREVQKAGIRICPQHVNVIPQLKVKENLALGDWPKTKYGLIDWDRLTKEVSEKAKRFGLDIDIERRTSTLSLSEQRQVNIIHALMAGAEIIILDEPTTSLTPEERNTLFKFMVELKKKENITFIFISHYSEEILEYCDSYTVLRNGKHIETGAVNNLDEDKLAELISGKKVEVFEREDHPDFGDLLQLRGLTGKQYQNIDLKLKKGEILGVAGLPGSGGWEVIRSLYGLKEIEDGEIYLEGSKVEINDPVSALENGISYLSNDRHGEGLVGLFSINDNIAMSNYDKGKNKYGLLDDDVIINRSLQVVNEYNVKTPSIYEKAQNLSGGNQQKVCLGMVFNTDPRIVMLDEPTRGIDVEVKEDVHRIIDRLSKEDKIGFIYYSTDFEEMCRVVDRILVFAEGQIVKELKGKDIKIRNILEAFSLGGRV